MGCHGALQGKEDDVGGHNKNPIIENWQAEIKKTQIVQYNNSTTLNPWNKPFIGENQAIWVARTRRPRPC